MIAETNTKLGKAVEMKLARWAEVHPSVTPEGLASQREYLRRNARLKCDMCKGWMATTLPTTNAPLLRADAPFAGICTKCLDGRYR